MIVWYSQNYPILLDADTEIGLSSYPLAITRPPANQPAKQLSETVAQKCRRQYGYRQGACYWTRTSWLCLPSRSCQMRQTVQRKSFGLSQGWSRCRCTGSLLFCINCNASLLQSHPQAIQRRSPSATPGCQIHVPSRSRRSPLRAYPICYSLEKSYCRKHAYRPSG